MTSYIATAIATLALAPITQAALVLFPNQNIPIPADFDGVYVNLQSGASGGAPFAGRDINFIFGGEGILNDADDGAVLPSLQFVRIGTGSNDAAVNLPLGAMVGPGSTFATGFGESGGVNDHLGTEFTDGTPGFLGFSLDLGGTTAYGYIDVTLTAGGVGSVNGWAYDDSGVGVTVDTIIPEPSAGFLSLFALGFLMLRRRR